jgi:anti-anti-sigma factor
MGATRVETNGKDVRLTCEGPLGVAVTQILRPQIQAALASGATTLTVDLANSDMIDSSGIGLLIAAHNSLQRAGGSLHVVGVSPEINSLFASLRLDQHFAIDLRQEGKAQ